MFVIMKNESGGFTVRPAYIGFIKNDIIRRVLCSLFYPLTVIVTLAINLIQASIVSLILFIKAVWFPLKGLLIPIWKTEIWQRPRTEKDANKRLNQPSWNQEEMTGLKKMPLFIIVLWALIDFKIAYSTSRLVALDKIEFDAEKSRPKGNGGGSIPLPCFVNQRAWPLKSMTSISHINEKLGYTLNCEL